MGVLEHANYSNSFTGVRFSDFKYKVALQWPTDRWNAASTQTITNNPPFQDDHIPTSPPPLNGNYVSYATSRTRPLPIVTTTMLSKALMNDLRKNAKALEAAFNFTAPDPTYSNVSEANLVIARSEQFNSQEGNPTPAGDGLLDGIEKILGVELTGVSKNQLINKSVLENAAKALEARAAYNNYANHVNYSNTSHGNGYVNLGYALPAPNYTNYYVNHSNAPGHSNHGNAWWCCHRNHSNSAHVNNGGNTSTGYLNYIVHYSNYSNANGPNGSVNATYSNAG